MTQAEVLKIVLALAAVLSQHELTDEESMALFLAAAKTVRPKRRKPKHTL